MRNFLKNYRNQDTGYRMSDEILLIAFFGMAIFLLLAIFTNLNQNKEIDQIKKQLEVVKVDKSVVAIEEDTYKKLIREYIEEGKNE